jgi:hypothetical protein
MPSGKRLRMGILLRWLSTMAILVVEWAWGCYGIWVGADRFSRLVQQSRHIRQWRTIADLADAMHEDMGPHLRRLSDSELRKRSTEAPLIKYSLAKDDEWGTEYVQLSSRRVRPVQLAEEAD